MRKDFFGIVLPFGFALIVFWVRFGVTAATVLGVLALVAFIVAMFMNHSSKK